MKDLLSKSTWLGVLLLILLAGPIGCAHQMGRYPCEGEECFGQNLWQKALDQISEQNFPGTRFEGKIYADHIDNAWTAQGNQVNITSNLMLKLDSRGDIYVLCAAAHEIAHLQAQHSQKKAELIHQDPQSLKMEERFGELHEDEALAALSRQQELEADILAIHYLKQLGYTRQDYLKFLKWMEKNLEDPPTSPLASHPTTRDRIDHIQQLRP